MINEPKKINIAQKLLIMMVLTFAMSLGWAIGHIMRQFAPRTDWKPAIPEFQHPLTTPHHR